VTFVAGTEPYPWPYDGGLDPARVALVVAGASGWAMSTGTTAVDALAALADLSAAVLAAGGTVVLVHHHCVSAPQARASLGLVRRGPAPGSTPVVEPGPGDRVVDARGVDGFSSSALDLVLRGAGVDRLLLAGVGLEGPVHSTLRSANDRGFECLTVVDACVAWDPALAAASVSSICMSGGIFGAVGTTGAVVAALGPVLQEVS